MVSSLRVIIVRKILSVFAVFIVLALFGKIDFSDRGYDSFFGQVRSYEIYEAGQPVELHTNVVNRADENIEDVKARMLIYDTGDVTGGTAFDVDHGDSYGRFLVWETGNVPPGEYLARITVSNDHFRKVRHRYITII